MAPAKMLPAREILTARFCRPRARRRRLSNFPATAPTAFSISMSTSPRRQTRRLLFSPARQPAGFTALCPTTQNCVPQLGTTNRLDGIGDRLMFRLAYRNFGDHEALVGNYTRQLGQRRRNSLVRVAQRHQWTSDEVSGEHLSTRYDLALDGKRGDGPAGQSRHRLQRFDLLRSTRRFVMRDGSSTIRSTR